MAATLPRIGPVLSPQITIVGRPLSIGHPSATKILPFKATNTPSAHLMRLMKRNSRTALLLTATLAAPLLASAIASRGREADFIRRTIRKSELSATDSGDSRNRPPHLPSTSGAATPVHFEVFKVQSLNKRHIHVGDSLVIPDASVDLMSASPFPIQLEVVRKIPKLVLVSRRVQAFGAYESGRLVRWGPTSTGKKSTPTPAGLYHANWKAKKRRSSVNQSWILPWCFNLDDTAGISFHQFDLPGYPASHGCVRLLEEDAKKGFTTGPTSGRFLRSTSQFWLSERRSLFSETTSTERSRSGSGSLMIRRRLQSPQRKAKSQ